MIAIVDYDAGNIKSVEKAFLSLGAQVRLTRDPKVIASAEKVVLPGVGNFGDAMNKLNTYGLTEPLYIPKASRSAWRTALLRTDRNLLHMQAPCQSILRCS